MKKFLKDESGATAIEYGLIAAAMGLAPGCCHAFDHLGDQDTVLVTRRPHYVWYVIAAATWPPRQPVVQEYRKRSLTGALFAFALQIMLDPDCGDAP